MDDLWVWLLVIVSIGQHHHQKGRSWGFNQQPKLDWTPTRMGTYTHINRDNQIQWIVSSLQYWARVLQQKGCMFFNHYHIGILSQHIVEYPPMIGTPRWIDLIWSNTAFRCRFIHQNHGSFSLRSKENWENTRLHWAHRKPGDHHPIHDWNERPTEKSHGRNRKKHMAFLLW